MSANPYRYGAPVSGDQFAGRHVELRAVTERMRDGINVLVLSPRRYGKTSLIDKAASRLRREGALVVSISAKGIAARSEFATQLVNATWAAKAGRWHRAKQAVPDFLSRIRLRATLTFDGDTPTFAVEPGLSTSDFSSVVGNVYEQLADHAADGTPAVLIVDEFQDVVDIDANLPAHFKALSDRYPSVALVVAGSKRHLMAQLALDVTAPLYGMTTLLALSPIPSGVMSDYLVRRAHAAGKTMAVDVADRIVDLAGPVPNNIQLLAYEIYSAAGRTITELDVEAGLRLAIEHGADLHATVFDRLSAAQRRIVKQLATTGGTAHPYSAEFRRAAHASSPGTLRTALKPLLEQDVVSEVDGVYRVANPFFAEWLEQRS